MPTARSAQVCRARSLARGLLRILYAVIPTSSRKRFRWARRMHCFFLGTKNMRSRHSLKPIRFEGELLPDWAQLLDLAASLSSAPESTRQWFSLFTCRTGVDDARTIVEHCDILRSALVGHRDSILAALAPGSGDSAPATIYTAWLYALDTMIEHASGAQTCAWHVEGTDDAPSGVDGGDDITLRRV